MLNARKLQMLAWAQMRVRINEFMSDDEIKQIRVSNTMKNAMEIILKKVTDHYGIGFPARVMQHDYYRDTLKQFSAEELERSTDELMSNSMRSIIENSNTVTLHLVAHMAIRLRNGSSPHDALTQLIKLDVPTIAANTKRVSHDNPFSDRVRPHPYFERDFDLLIGSVMDRGDKTVFGENGEIIREEGDDRGRRRGGCPAQSGIQHRNASEPLPGSLAKKTRETVELLKESSRIQFNVQSQFSEPPTIAELFVTINLLALAKPQGPLREDSEFFREVIKPLVGKKLAEPREDRINAPSLSL